MDTKCGDPISDAGMRAEIAWEYAGFPDPVHSVVLRAKASNDSGGVNP